MDQEPEMDDEPVDDAEADESEEFSSNPNQVGNGSNGTTQGKSTFSFLLQIVLFLTNVECVVPCSVQYCQMIH